MLTEEDVGRNAQVTESITQRGGLQKTARPRANQETGPLGCTVDEIAEVVSLSKRTIERRYMKQIEAGKIAAMSEQHSKATILSMAIITAGLAALLHEGLGHGVTAWLRGDIPTQLTSNHLSTLRADRWVDAAGTLVNLPWGFSRCWRHGPRGPAPACDTFAGFSPRTTCCPAQAIFCSRAS